MREPFVFAALLATWLLLNNTLAPAHLLLGGALAFAATVLTARFRPDRTRLGRPLELTKLTLRVLADIVTSNFVLARGILGPQRAIRPRFVAVPLDVCDPHAIVALAGIVTMTPGTLSVEVVAAPDEPDRARQRLIVHAFHVDDEGALIESIKHRYEQPLMRIFEGRP